MKRVFSLDHQWAAPLVAGLLSITLVVTETGRAQDTPAAAADSGTLAPALFSRVITLGASVTAGFDMSQPLGGPKALQYRFASYIEAALTATHEPVATQASALLFLNAQETLEKKVSATIAGKPTLVIGLDTLFWFCYGGGMSSEQRLARFEYGLHQLDRIDAPLVIGDIPDATKAVGGILDKGEMPELSVIAECNQRLKTWAAGHRNVTLFPLSSIMAVATANEELSVGGITWEKGKSRVLLRADHLHPSRHGLAALAIAVLDAAAGEAAPNLITTGVLHDLDAVYTAGIARAEAEAAKAAAAGK